LQFISRSDYRVKERESFIEELRRTHGEFFLIPEGGSNQLAVKGVAELAAKLPEADYICTACGTGGTLAGLAAGLRGRLDSPRVIGFSVLKDESIRERIKNLLSRYAHTSWELISDYHFGGYARAPVELRSFMTRFESVTRIPLDHVYTAKMFFGVIDLIRKGYFNRGSTVLALHTGGLQGRLTKVPSPEGI
jgi:1-aminocyclopropane-1-carboxylate deaminase